MYTVRQLLEDLEGFSLDAIIKNVTDGDEDFFCITNPTPIEGAQTWYFGDYEVEPREEEE